MTTMTNLFGEQQDTERPLRLGDIADVSDHIIMCHLRGTTFDDRLGEECPCLSDPRFPTPERDGRFDMAKKMTRYVNVAAEAREMTVLKCKECHKPFPPRYDWFAGDWQSYCSDECEWASTW